MMYLANKMRPKRIYVGIRNLLQSVVIAILIQTGLVNLVRLIARPSLNRLRVQASRTESAVERESYLSKAYRIFRWLYPPGGHVFELAELASGLRLKVNLCEREGRRLYLGEEYEPYEMALVGKLVNPGAVFFDIGAHVGLYSLTASRLVGPTGMVHAFEPALRTYDVLTTNLYLNGAANVVTNRIAINDQSGEVDLLVNRESGLTSLGATGRGQIIDVEKVASVSLDQYTATEGIAELDFLKIDVEGYEGHVLRGARGVIERSPNMAVLCELAGKNYRALNLSNDEVINLMCAWGFEAWEINSTRPALDRLKQNRLSDTVQNVLFVRPDTPMQHVLVESIGDSFIE